MQNKEYSTALDATIEWLEGEQEAKRELLSERFREGYDSLKPINLIKSTVKDLTASATTMDDLIGPLLGLAAGHLTKKLVIGKSEDETRQAVGAALQVGVTNLVIQNQDAIKSAGKFAWRFIFGRRRPTPSDEEAEND
jgi:hypothetical protein